VFAIEDGPRPLWESNKSITEEPTGRARGMRVGELEEAGTSGVRYHELGVLRAKGTCVNELEEGSTESWRLDEQAHALLGEESARGFGDFRDARVEQVLDDVEALQQALVLEDERVRRLGSASEGGVVRCLWLHLKV